MNTSRTNRAGSAVVSLPSDTEILITRQFDAPASLVWETLTRPEHVLRWWGPEWCPLVSAQIDLRVGGAWRYIARMDDGSELAWSGEYREIDAPRSITSTECFEGFPDAVSLNTMTLTEVAGVTTLQTLVRHQSMEFRDGHVNSGMEGGMQQTFNRLDTLLASSGTLAERFRRVAGAMSDVVAAVPNDAWGRPGFCPGWTAEDPVRHLIAWVPSLFAQADVDLSIGDAADASPGVAWEAFRTTVQAVLDDPAQADREIDLAPVGRHTVAAAIDQFVTGDVIVHVWDVATAAGIDWPIERYVPADIAGPMADAMLAISDMLVASGHYGSPVEVPSDASPQVRLIAATGRDPNWHP